MAHVGVKRLGAGHAQKDAAEHEKSRPAARNQEFQAVPGVERDEDQGMLHDAVESHQRHRDKPDEHDRAEQAPDPGRPHRLHREQREQNDDRGGQDIGRQRRRRLLHAFQRGEHRNRRRDRAVAVDQRSAEQPCRHDRRTMHLLNSEQRHQRDDAALAVVVDAHGEIDVFDRRDHEEGPQDQRQRAERRGRVGMRAGKVEHGLERVERAGADIAEDDAERGEAHGGQGRFGRRDRFARLRSHRYPRPRRSR